MNSLNMELGLIRRLRKFPYFHCIGDEGFIVSPKPGPCTSGSIDNLLQCRSSHLPKLNPPQHEIPVSRHLPLAILQPCPPIRSLTFRPSCSCINMRHAIPHLGLHDPTLHHAPILDNPIRDPCSAAVLSPTSPAPLDVLLRAGLELLA